MDALLSKLMYWFVQAFQDVPRKFGTVTVKKGGIEKTPEYPTTLVSFVAATLIMARFDGVLGIIHVGTDPPLTPVV